MEKLQSYGEAFAKIQAATGISDIDELVNTFINAEDENYRLFKYVDELNQEIQKLEDQIADIKAEIEKYKGQGVNTDNQRKNGCNTEAAREMLGTEGVTEQNMMQYLGIIEQRTNEILQMYAASQAAAQGQDPGALQASVLGQGPQTPAGSTVLNIEPPSTTDDVESDSSEDEEDDHPLTRSELQGKMEKKLKRGGEDKKKAKRAR